jgi:hypothetical protein
MTGNPPSKSARANGTASRSRSIVTTGITVVPRNSACMMASSCQGGIGAFYATDRAREADRQPGRKTARTLAVPIRPPSSATALPRA